jgi:transposase
VADDLGVGYSTLDRWIGRHRDQSASVSVVGESPADELKRLRRENQILREEREILKKATAFFAKEGNR